VARLAGVTEIVLARANAILADLESGAPLPGGHAASLRSKAQLDPFASPPEIDPSAPCNVERGYHPGPHGRLGQVEASANLADALCIRPAKTHHIRLELRRELPPRSPFLGIDFRS